MMDGQRILEQVAAERGVTVPQIKGVIRAGPVLAARFAAIARMRTELGWTLARIGRAVGDRDQSTIRSALKKMGLS